MSSVSLTVLIAAIAAAVTTTAGTFAVRAFNQPKSNRCYPVLLCHMTSVALPTKVFCKPPAIP